MSEPTHLHIPTGAHVFPGGYPADDLRLLTAAETSTKAMDDALAGLRAKRDQLLTECDWTQLPDCPLSVAARAAWTTYRQELRDLPGTTDVLDPTWPTPPT